MLKSVMTHQFSQVPTVDAPRSKFDRSCGYKTTFDASYLIPFYVDEVLPGDTFDVDATLFVRMASALQVPIMDNMFLETFFFFVPNRLVWSHFVNFMGEQDNPNDSTDYLIPTISSGDDGFAVGSLFDYAGVPTDVPNLTVNALPFNGMLRIWDEWFRDENLQDSLYRGVDEFIANGGDGPFDKSLYPMLIRGKRHDYYTSALPWPQKGPAVDLPLGTTAPVVGNGQGLGITAGDGVHEGTWCVGYSGSGTLSSIRWINETGVTLPYDGTQASAWNSVGSAIGVSTDSATSGLIADLSEASAATVNSLRQAFQLQKFYEKDARGGTRYIEKILVHFGVKSPDARLQRTEYLGGSSARIDINQVAQTSASNADGDLGQLGAYGLSSSTGHGFVKSFVEHGYVIGFVNIRADLTYQQGLDRMFSRQTMVDFYWPTFAHLGEQPVYNKEIYAQGSAVVDAQGNIVDDQVFGYQERYAEYRYKPSKITGKLRSTDPQTLDVWHLSQKFEQLPVLNSEFIEDSAKDVIDRVVAVQDEPQFILDSYIRNICIREMPVYSVPGLVDHF